MSYHPLMGVTFFFIIIIISYLLGRKVSIDSKLKKKQNLKINLKSKQEKNSSDVISPDASWLD